jgi:hypothetical protein
MKMLCLAAGSIDNLDKLSGLTHLALANPCVHSRRPGSATAADADLDFEAAAAAIEGENDPHHHHQQQQQLPGAVAALGDVLMSHPSDDGSSSSRSSSSSGSPMDAAVVPGSVGRLRQLQHLVLDHITPDWSVLSQLTDLDKLEVRVSGEALKARGGGGGGVAAADAGLRSAQHCCKCWGIQVPKSQDFNKMLWVLRGLCPKPLNL